MILAPQPFLASLDSFSLPTAPINKTLGKSGFSNLGQGTNNRQDSVGIQMSIHVILVALQLH